MRRRRRRRTTRADAGRGHQTQEGGAIATRAEGVRVGTEGGAAVAAENIIVSMVRETKVGTGVIAADRGHILLHLLHLPRVVGHLRDHQMRRKETCKVAEEGMTPGAAEVMIGEEGSVEPQFPMSIPTFKGVFPKSL